MDKKKKAVYGIIGCGNIAKSHADAIAKNRSSILGAVFDIDPLRAKKFAAKYRCKATPDLPSLLGDKNIDVVTICTPHDTHKELILKILRSGKYCVCEKPLCLSTKDCRDIIRIDREKKVITVFQVRFHKPVQLLLEYVRKGILGKILFFSLFVRKNPAPPPFFFFRSHYKKNRGLGFFLPKTKKKKHFSNISLFFLL